MASPDENSSSSDVKVLDSKEEEGATCLLATQLSPELKEEWTKNKPHYGLKHFLRYLLNSGKLCDVTFLVKREGSDLVERIVGHKCILKSKSDFFDALFSGRWENGEVDLTKADFNSTDFKSFQEFLYLQEISLNAENVISLYSLSNLYQVTDLQGRCETFLGENVNDDNALSLFNILFLHKEGKGPSPALMTIVRFIIADIEAMIEKPEMLNLSRAHLAFIFTRCGNARIRKSQIKLLRFCLRWTVKNFGRKELFKFVQVDRYIEHELGLEGLPKLRDLLTFNESGSLGKPSAKVDLNAVYECVRLKDVSPDKKWIFRRNRADRISFRITEPIILTGLGLYSDMKMTFMWQRLRAEEDRKPTKYDVTVRIHIHGKEHNLAYFGMHSGGADVDHTGIYRLDINPVYLQADEWYTISVEISGPGSYSGHTTPDHAEKLLRCGNTPVIIQFRDASCKDESAKLANGTGLTIGQIPKLFFKLLSTIEDDEDDEVQVLDK